MSYGHTPRRTTARATASGEGRWQRRGMLLIGLLALGMLAALVAGANAVVPIKLLPLAVEPPRLDDRVYVITESVDRDWNVTSLLTALDSGGGPPAYAIADADDAQISPDGALLFVLHGRELRGHDATTGALRWERGFDELFGGFEAEAVQALVPSADGRSLFAVAISDGAARRLIEVDPASGQVAGQPVQLTSGWQTSHWLAAPGGDRLYEVVESGQIQVIDLAQRQIAARINLTHAALGAAISTDGAAMYVLTSGFAVAQIDLRTNAVGDSRSLGIQPERLRLGGLWLLPGPPARLLVGTYNLSRPPFAELREYDLADWRELRRVPSDKPLDWSLMALGSAGRQLFAATDGGLRDDNTIRAFDLETGEARLLLDAPMPPVRRVLAGPPFVRRLPPPAPALGALPALPLPAPLAGPRDGGPLAYVLQYHPTEPTAEFLAVDPNGRIETLAEGLLALVFREEKPPLLYAADTGVLRDPLAGASPPLTITIPPNTTLGPGVMSPDERWITWQAARDDTPTDGKPGESLLLVADTRGGAARQVALPESADASPHLRGWSADGLAMVAEFEGKTAVYLTDPLADQPAWRLDMQFDGQLLEYRPDVGLALLSRAGDDGHEIVLRKLSSGEETSLTADFDQIFEGMIPGAGRVGMSPDGNKLALLRPRDDGGSDLYVLDTASGAGEMWGANLDVNELGGWLNWTSSGQLLVSITARGREFETQQQVLLYDGAGGKLLDKLTEPQFGMYSTNGRGQLFLARAGARQDDPSVLEIYQIAAPNVAPVQVTLKPGYVGYIYAP